VKSKVTRRVCCSVSQLCNEQQQMSRWYSSVIQGWCNKETSCFNKIEIECITSVCMPRSVSLFLAQNWWA
jgi:hypothetical protein